MSFIRLTICRRSTTSLFFHPRLSLSTICARDPSRVSISSSQRYFSASPRKTQQPQDAKTAPDATSPASEKAVYHGPLTATFRRLKLFSLASLSLSSTLSPFFFIIESNLPGFARAALAATALSTSVLTTALVAWATRPYVTTLRRLDPSTDGAKGLEMTTFTLTLSPRITRVYDLEFLVETDRPLAKWELAREVILPAQSKDGQPIVGKEETVAETLDKHGKVLGSWVVKWKENGEGDCREIGKVVRHFNVHPELLR
ncbi:hypothetical protein K435DRAFT_960289 [Dendrothele bispora CBS 962.96]|uniref:Uncharacterized protein n=1 Tax=Dendrothele bispora (strain CBS 962.96) TaxID=1314807 RepID=A0A4S8MTX1_DENBC|nr:hypothetical protein K435DRAFT_960289 [Dendrothele bispora CBS 962.96]